jgi:hypothetical protein
MAPSLLLPNVDLLFYAILCRINRLLASARKELESLLLASGMSCHTVARLSSAFASVAYPINIDAHSMLPHGVLFTPRFS